MTRQEFIDRYKAAAIRSTRGTRLFPSVVMAQAILESGDGNSTLATDYNNFFGIKADTSWNGGIAILETNEWVNGEPVSMPGYFRTYNSPTESFRDHVKFLKENDRYGDAGVFSARTPEGQALALQEAGYSTSPYYATTISQIIERNNLKELDPKINLFLVAALVVAVALLAAHFYNQSK